jgi:hypothetical protein
MKIRRPLFLAVVAATAVSLASIAVSAVAAETPFKGTFNGVETSEVVFPIASVTRDGTGTATYLGKYTSHASLQVNVMTFLGTGVETFTAANGDTLSTSVVGRGTPIGPIPPTMLSIVEVYTITGGTGRFAGATGSFTLENTLDLITHVSSGTFSGAIDR